MSCVNERRVIENEEESEMKSFNFSRRMKHLNKRHLSVSRSASEGFKSCTQLLSLLQKSMKC